MDDTETSMTSIQENRAKRRLDRTEKIRNLGKNIRRDVSITANTPEGFTLLKHLFEICGAGLPSTVVKDGEIQIQSTLHNEAMRGVWLKLRELIPPRILFEIEIAPTGETEDDVS